jgi:hypothetical protein
VKAFERRLWMLEYRLRQAEMDTADLLFRTKYAYDSVRQADAEYRRKTDATAWADPPTTGLDVTFVFDGYNMLDGVQVDKSTTATLDLSNTSGDWIYTPKTYYSGPGTPLTSSIPIPRWADKDTTSNANRWFRDAYAQLWYNTATFEWKILWGIYNSFRANTSNQWFADTWWEMDRTGSVLVESNGTRITASDRLWTTLSGTDTEYTMTSDANFYRHPDTTARTLVSTTNPCAFISATVTW